MTSERPLPPLATPIQLAGEVPLTVPGLAGEPDLEALVFAPPTPRQAVVLCHAHPQRAGSMHCKVMVAIVERLIKSRDCATLRFNYRGVGASAGAFGRGRGEILDVRASMQFLAGRHPEAELALCGHSFGAGVALRAAAAEGGVHALALVAPANRIHASLLDRARAKHGFSIVVGDQDPFCDVERLRADVADTGATLHIIEHGDHFFLDTLEEVAQAAVMGLISEHAT